MVEPLVQQVADIARLVSTCERLRATGPQFGLLYRTLKDAEEAANELRPGVLEAELGRAREHLDRAFEGVRACFDALELSAPEETAGLEPPRVEP